MSIRAWSFTKLWTVTAVSWFAAMLAEAASDYFDVFDGAVLVLALVPAFLAGAWAGEHAEIGTWPRARVVAMWVVAGAAYFGATDMLDHWRLAAVAVAAPVAVLTFRWYELTEAARTLPSAQAPALDPPSNGSPETPTIPR